MRALYLVLCVLGTALPLSQFLPWLAEHGFALGPLLQQAFVPPIAAFAWYDVLVSALALIAIVVVEGRRIGLPRPWLPIVALACVGVSLALPLFLLMREHHLRRQRA